MITTAFTVIPITTPEQRAQWDAFASRSEVGHMHQCLWWADPLTDYGVEARVVGCWNGGELVGGALFRSVRVPLTRMTVLECLNGPIFLDWKSAWAGPFVAGVARLAESLNSGVLTIRACPRSDVVRDTHTALCRAGHRVETTPGRSTASLPLSGRTLDEIWTGLNRGTKRNITKGTAAGVSVRAIVEPGELRHAHATWKATAARKHFSDVRPWSGLEPVLLHCIKEGLGGVHASYLNGRLLAAIFVTYLGNKVEYHYGGYLDGVEQNRPNHVLHYDAIRRALNLGAKAYDFGNLMDPDRLGRSGVDQFKIGFGAIPTRCSDTIIWERKRLFYRGVRLLKRHPIGRQLITLWKDYLVERNGAGDGHLANGRALDGQQATSTADRD
jgi:hypothetical protein